MDALGFNLPSLLVFLVNFSLLLVLLYLFAYKPVLKILDDRSSKIKESLEAADKAREEAAQSEVRTQENLQEARREGQRLLDQARELAERYREDEMSKARQEAKAFIGRTRQEIQQERDGAIEEVKSHFATLAIQAAERVIGQSLDAESHRELIAKVLEEGHEMRRE